MALSTTGHKSHPPLPSPPPLCHRSYPSSQELEDLAMAATLGIKTFLLLSLLLLAPLLSSGFVEGFKEGVNPHHSFVKDGIQMINTRKLLVEVLDYDDAGANRRHDPRGRTGGAGGGKNP